MAKFLVLNDHGMLPGVWVSKEVDADNPVHAVDVCMHDDPEPESTVGWTAEPLEGTARAWYINDEKPNGRCIVVAL